MNQYNLLELKVEIDFGGGKSCINWVTRLNGSYVKIQCYALNIEVFQ